MVESREMLILTVGILNFVLKQQQNFQYLRTQKFYGTPQLFLGYSALHCKSSDQILVAFFSG